ncbi:MDIS1-interacting receptor like kinase 1 [Vitis vinifera]|uniref:MDIS1-interacting receptor like kinase 1 n=1 Tax=Vitis vinifera TaxID=29760 RepID=A0A438HUS0_VITVI|nr:MDIS1-interacting receptor like kinase 1 [Vitis vinifera]
MFLFNPENLAWLSHILSLRFLDLSLVDLGAAIQWSQAINKLHSLVHLNLNGCVLLPFTTGTTLVHLDLSSNDLNGSILDGFGNMISLAYLDLRYCAFEGEILFAFGDMRALEYLDISGHGLHEGILDAIGDLASLTYLELFVNQLKALPKTFELFLSHNELEGEIPKSFGRRLVILDLSSNRLYGSIPDTVGSMVSFESLSLFESTPK